MLQGIKRAEVSQGRDPGTSEPEPEEKFSTLARGKPKDKLQSTRKENGREETSNRLPDRVFHKNVDLAIRGSSWGVLKRTRESKEGGRNPHVKPRKASLSCLYLIMGGFGKECDRGKRKKRERGSRGTSRNEKRLTCDSTEV